MHNNLRRRFHKCFIIGVKRGIMLHSKKGKSKDNRFIRRKSNMIRIMGLICVFGIASLCLATFIRASTAYARSARAMCPCWPGGITELEATLGPPKTINITLDPCDTKQQQTFSTQITLTLQTLAKHSEPLFS